MSKPRDLHWLKDIERAIEKIELGLSQFVMGNGSGTPASNSFSVLALTGL
jgi:hypothetical protein